METNFCRLLLLAVLLMSAACSDRGNRMHNESEYQKMIDTHDEGSMEPATSALSCEVASLQELPVSAYLTRGTLDNGLEYYVEDYPKDDASYQDKAAVELYVKVGSVVENDNERGVAHFIEHLVLAETRNYSDKSVFETMGRIGLFLGRGVNAFTSFNSTTFEFSEVPLGRNPEYLDTCLNILRDFASECTLNPAMVERERGIVLEEMNFRKDYRKQSIIGVASGTRYADRMPLGDREIVSNISVDGLRRFYEKWYQPQNMAVIVRSCVDKELVIKKIHEIFSSLERGDTEIPDYRFCIPRHRLPNTVVITGRSATKAEITFSFSMADDTLMNHRNTLAWYVDEKARTNMATVIKKRLNRIAAATKLFDVADCSLCDVFVGARPLLITLALEPENWQKAVEAVAGELEKIRQFGLTQKEARLCNFALESKVNLTDSVMFKPQRYNTFRMKNIRPLITQEYYIDSETETQLANHIGGITVGYGLAMFRKIVADSNLTICVVMPDSFEGPIPDSELILKACESAKKQVDEVEKYKYAEDQNLYRLAHELKFDFKPGEVVQRSDDWLGRTTKLTLANGVEVEIIHAPNNNFGIKGVRYGAMTNYSDADAKRLKLLQHVADDPFRYSDDDTDQFHRLLFNDEFDYIMTYSTVMSGEDQLKTIVARLTNDRIDSVRFENYKQFLRTQKSPSPVYSGNYLDLWNQTLYGKEYKDRTSPLSIEELESITLDEMRELSKKYRRNFNGMRFVIESTYAKDSIIPLVVKYLGMLPSEPDRVETKDIKALHFAGQPTDTTYICKSEKPSAEVMVGYAQEKNAVINVEESIKLDALLKILRTKLISNIRLKNGNVYSFIAEAGMFYAPVDQRSFYVYTVCDTLSVSGMIEAIDTEISNLTTEGYITEQEVENYIRSRMKNYRDYPQWNEFVDYKALCFMRNGKEVHLNDKCIIEGLTPEKLRDFATDFIGNGVKHRFVVRGK